jgi:hypothetical protein
MKPTTCTQAASQRQQRPAVSILPAGYFARIGGADLSPAERQLVEDFRQMNLKSREMVMRFMPKLVEHDREQRIAAMAPKFQLVRGGAP